MGKLPDKKPVTEKEKTRMWRGKANVTSISDKISLYKLSCLPIIRD